MMEISNEKNTGYAQKINHNKDFITGDSEFDSLINISSIEQSYFTVFLNSKMRDKFAFIGGLADQIYINNNEMSVRIPYKDAYVPTSLSTEVRENFTDDLNRKNYKTFNNDFKEQILSKEEKENQTVYNCIKKTIIYLYEIAGELKTDIDIKGTLIKNLETETNDEVKKVIIRTMINNCGNDRDIKSIIKKYRDNENADIAIICSKFSGNKAF